MTLLSEARYLDDYTCEDIQSVVDEYCGFRYSLQTSSTHIQMYALDCQGELWYSQCTQSDDDDDRLACYLSGDVDELPLLKSRLRSHKELSQNGRLRVMYGWKVNAFHDDRDIFDVVQRCTDYRLVRWWWILLFWIHQHMPDPVISAVCLIVASVAQPYWALMIVSIAIRQVWRIHTYDRLSYSNALLVYLVCRLRVCTHIALAALLPLKWRLTVMIFYAPYLFITEMPPDVATVKKILWHWVLLFGWATLPPLALFGS